MFRRRPRRDRHATTTLYTPTREAFADLLAGEPRYRLDQLWDGLYTQLAAPADITNVPKALRDRIAAELPTALTQQVRRVSDGGDTVKYLWSLADGSQIETVLMLYPDRVTVCVSSQAGCAMACGFCATGQAGFHTPAYRRRDRRASRSRSTRCAGDGSSPRQRCLHGHGRADGQPAGGVGIGRTPARRRWAFGTSHHGQHRRHRARHSQPSPKSSCRSTWRCRCTRPTTSYATSSCRSTSAIHSTT